MTAPNRGRQGIRCTVNRGGEILSCGSLESPSLWTLHGVSMDNVNIVCILYRIYILILGFSSPGHKGFSHVKFLCSITLMIKINIIVNISLAQILCQVFQTKYFTWINPFNHDSSTMTENYYLYFQNVETQNVETFGIEVK